MEIALTLKIPIELKSEANTMQHWTAKHKRRKSQIWSVKCAWLEKKQKNVSTPCKIILCRHSPRKLDYDNLVSAFKWIRDAIADLIKPGYAPGRADEKDDIEFFYYQRKSKEKFVTIEIYEK